MTDQQVINALKGLVIDGVHKAGSGHPGGAMSSMDLAYILFTEYLQFDPKDPTWSGRDRFILSAGHESMLIYSLLFASGYLEMKDLQAFRQIHSRTPGHPENFMTPGVECTTGPLGQGAAMSVGFAAASSHFAEVLDRKLFSYRTWVLLGDGCMQEDVTYGAASLAGHLRLNQLIWIYDRNKAQISGHINRVTSDDEKKIYEGLGWQVICIDGHDHRQIRNAYEKAGCSEDKPTLIIADTIMAKGSASLEGSHKTHGAPLPPEDRNATRQALGLPSEAFYWNEEIDSHFKRNFSRKSQQVGVWKNHLQEKLQDKSFQMGWNSYFGEIDLSALPKIAWEKAIATRSAFGKILAQWALHLPSLVGGSADLEPSNMTGEFAKLVGDFQAMNRKGRNFAFGVREFPMSAFVNGLALHGGLIPFDATFLTFSDYSRPALRLGAIQKARVIHEFTHDSFYLGEDGPTHQPIEHLMSLRLIPDLYVMRPADAYETELMLKVALKLNLPSCVCLSRQDLPLLPVSSDFSEKASKGAWFVRGDNFSDMVLYATGSEVSLALKVADELIAQKIHDVNSVAVVSIPCWELFFEQDKDYIDRVLASGCRKKVSIEAGSTLGWQKFVGAYGLSIGIDHYGASGKACDLEKEFGFTPQAVVKKIKSHHFN